MLTNMERGRQTKLHIKFTLCTTVIQNVNSAFSPDRFVLTSAQLLYGAGTASSAHVRYMNRFFGHESRAVLTNGHTGHVPRAPGFFFQRPPTGCGEIIFLINYLIVDATARSYKH